MIHNVYLQKDGSLYFPYCFNYSIVKKIITRNLDKIIKELGCEDFIINNKISAHKICEDEYLLNVAVQYEKNISIETIKLRLFVN